MHHATFFALIIAKIFTCALHTGISEESRLPSESESILKYVSLKVLDSQNKLIVIWKTFVILLPVKDEKKMLKKYIF